MDKQFLMDYLELETMEQAEKAIVKLNEGGEFRRLFGELLVRDFIDGLLVKAGGKQ